MFEERGARAIKATLEAGIDAEIARQLALSPDVGGYDADRDNIKEYQFGELIPVEVYPTIGIYTTGAANRAPQLTNRQDFPSEEVLIEAYIDIYMSWDDYQQLYFRLIRCTAAIREILRKDPSLGAVCLGSSIPNHMNSNLFRDGRNLHQASRTVARLWMLDTTS